MKYAVNSPISRSLALASLTVAISTSAFAQSVVYRENFTFGTTSNVADTGWTVLWDGPFNGSTFNGTGVFTGADSVRPVTGLINAAGVSVGGAASVASSPAVADAANGFIYLDMQFKNPPNEIPRAILLSTVEVASLSLNSANITSIGFHANDSGFGNQPWAEPFTGRATLLIGGVWYVSNTSFIANNTASFQAFNFDMTGTWATIADSSVALTFTGTGSLAAGSLQAAGVLVTQPDNAAYLNFDQFSITAIPEPSTFAALAGVAALGLVAYRRRRA